MHRRSILQMLGIGAGAGVVAVLPTIKEEPATVEEIKAAVEDFDKIAVGDFDEIPTDSVALWGESVTVGIIIHRGRRVDVGEL